MSFKIFEQIQIMTIQGCNLKCKFCPNKYMEQSHDKIDIDIFLKIIKELSEINYNQRITLYLQNEPFLDDRLPELVLMTRNKCPAARINISTNGIIPTYDDMDFLFNNGLTDADISCYNQTTWDKWKDYKEYNVNVMNMIDPTWVGLNNRGGNVPEYGSPGKIGVGGCQRPSIQMYINAYGEAVLCCSDYKREVVMGNVIENTLIEIWNNEKYQKYRDDLKTGKRNLLLCKTCNF